MNDRSGLNPLVTAGIVLGIGLGGFLDGIVFHQLLQLHSLLSNRLPKTTVPNVEINMFWDGVFHVFTWIATVVGVGMLWSVARRREVPLETTTLVGAVLAGWGAFNLVEGLIDHQILGLHHVVERAENHLPADMAFLASGAILIAIGWGMIRGGRHRVAMPAPLAR